MTIDLKILQQLASPAKAAEAKAAGLPTIDPTKFQAAVNTHLENQSSSMLDDVMKSVGSILKSADSMISDSLGSVSDLTNQAKKMAAGKIPSNIAGGSGAAEMLKQQTLLAQIKQAKEHAIATGNFIPLLSFTQPELNLKSLPKDMVVLPALPNMPTLADAKDKLAGVVSSVNIPKLG